jgi:3-mercaptopyruvate sulfurtransferase SseA
VALELRRHGYRGYALVGGLEKWQEAGYPTEAKQAEQGRTLADVCPDCAQPLAAHRPGAARQTGMGSST